MITVDDMGIIIRARHFESGMMCMLLPCLSSYSYFNNSPGSSNHKKNPFSNFQCIDGISAEMRNDFGITEADYYNYLNEHNCYTVDGTDDKKDFEVNFYFNAVSFYSTYLLLCLNDSYLSHDFFAIFLLEPQIWNVI